MKQKILAIVLPTVTISCATAADYYLTAEQLADLLNVAVLNDLPLGLNPNFDTPPDGSTGFGAPPSPAISCLLNGIAPLPKDAQYNQPHATTPAIPLPLKGTALLPKDAQYEHQTQAELTGDELASLLDIEYCSLNEKQKEELLGVKQDFDTDTPHSLYSNTQSHGLYR